MKYQQMINIILQSLPVTKVYNFCEDLIQKLPNNKWKIYHNSVSSSKIEILPSPNVVSNISSLDEVENDNIMLNYEVTKFISSIYNKFSERNLNIMYKNLNNLKVQN